MTGLLSLLLLNAPIAVAFESTNGRAYLPVRINEKIDAFFVLDSGAAATIIDLEYGRSLGLKMGGEVQASGVAASAKGGAVEGATVTVRELRELSGPIQYALPLSPLFRLEGRPMFGILGTSFFQRNPLEIDYARGVVRFFSAETLPRQGTPVPITWQGNLPVVDLELTIGGKSRTVRGLVDTGATGALSLTKAFVDRNPDVRDANGTKPVIGSGGVGGMSLSRSIRADSLKIAGVELARPVVSLTLGDWGSAGKSATYDAIIGAETLRRFRISFDYAGGKLYMTPNRLAVLPFPVDHSGLMVAAMDDSYARFAVVGTVPGQAGEGAGFKAGDEILEIDATPASRLTLDGVRRRFREPSRTWQVKIRRGGSIRLLELAGRSILN